MPTLTIHLSAHAVERFQQRARPALDAVDALDELARLVLVGDVVDTPPRWHARGCSQLAPWYLVIADVLLPLKQHLVEPGVLVATTCFVRGEHSDDVRRRRRMQRRATRAEKVTA